MPKLCVAVFTVWRNSVLLFLVQKNNYKKGNQRLKSLFACIIYQKLQAFLSLQVMHWPVGAFLKQAKMVSPTAAYMYTRCFGLI